MVSRQICNRVPTMDRRATGISFLQGFFDSSIVLIAQSKGQAEKSFGDNLVSWMGPLDYPVWALTVVFAVSVGFLYAFIESGVEGSDLDRGHPAGNVTLSIFSKLLLFTGGGEMRAGPASRLFVMCEHAPVRRRVSRQARNRQPCLLSLISRAALTGPCPSPPPAPLPSSAPAPCSVTNFLTF